MNFKESVMSATPKNLPKRTRVLAKDLLFQEKYALTDTQVDIMSYIFNAFTWAMKIDGYIVLTSKKFMLDLPQIGEKTLEATLKELERKSLISKRLVNVQHWGNVRVRGIKISSAGMEYNSSLYAPSHQEILKIYQNRIKELEVKLEEKIASELEEQIPSEVEELTPENNDLEDKKETQSADSKSQEEPKKEHKEVSFEAFIKSVRDRFILTSAPICNMVEGWQHPTTFYINSYGKLSLTTQNRDFKQLNNPIEISKFWKWLFQNQNRVGEIIDLKNITKKTRQLNKKYKNKEITLNGKIRWIDEIVAMNEGVAIKVRNEKGEEAIVINVLKEPLIYDYKGLENFIKKHTPIRS